jgi:hypothetical protein
MNGNTVDAAIAAILDPLVWRTIRDIPLLPGYQRLVYGRSGMARQIMRFQPDRASVELAAQNNNPYPLNRSPGDIKCSWKWRTEWQHIGNPDDQEYTQFRQVLTQLQFYMRQHGARYGYILTDEELLCVRRPGPAGELELAAPVQWGAHHVPGQGQPGLTIALALVALHLLAGDPTQWDAPIH